MAIHTISTQGITITIQKYVMDEFRVEFTDMVGKSRLPQFVIAKHVSYYLCFLAGFTDQKILAQVHGLKKGNHTHIMKKIQDLKETDPAFRITLNKLMKKCGLETAKKKEKIIHELRRIQSGDFHRMSIDEIIEVIENEL
jgi:hypothetical protein